jgi:hypothetical protein
MMQNVVMRATMSRIGFSDLVAQAILVEDQGINLLDEILLLSDDEMDKVSTLIVPRAAEHLQAQWDAAAALTVMELEVGCGNFKVVEVSSLQEQYYECDDRIGQMLLLVGSQQVIHHIVKLA